MPKEIEFDWAVSYEKLNNDQRPAADIQLVVAEKILPLIAATLRPEEVTVQIKE